MTTSESVLSVGLVGALALAYYFYDKSKSAAPAPSYVSPTNDMPMGNLLDELAPATMYPHSSKPSMRGPSNKPDVLETVITKPSMQ